MTPHDPRNLTQKISDYIADRDIVITDDDGIPLVSKKPMSKIRGPETDQFKVITPDDLERYTK